MTSWLAGAQTTDITPRTLGDWLAGYMPKRRSKGLHRPLTARAVALTAQDQTVIWIALDLVGFKNSTTRKIQHKVSQATGVPAKNVWVMATHTHSAPDLIGLFGGPPAGYEALVVDRATEAARLAFSQRELAEVKTGNKPLTGGVVNRREPDKSVHDDTLQVLEARSPKGKVIFTLVNFSCHPVVLGRTSPWVSPDFVGALREDVEANRGGLTIFFNRAHGDVNPDRLLVNAVKDETNPDKADAFGKIMAQAVLAVLPNTKVAPTLTVDRFDGPVPITRPGMWLLGHAGFGEMASFRQIRTEFSRASLGGVSCVGLPGEPLGRFSLAVQKADPSIQLVFALSGGYGGYLLTEEDFRPGGYEEMLFVGHDMLKALETWLSSFSTLVA